MKRLFFLAMLGLFIACSKSTIDKPSSDPTQSEVYVYDNITFISTGNEDATTLESFPRKGSSFWNGTSVDQTAILNSQQKSTSTFMYGSDLDSLLLEQDTIYVQVPVSLGSNGQVVLSDATWPLINSYVIRPLEKAPTRIAVKPNTLLTVTGTIIQKVLKTSFIVTLKGIQSGQQKQIMGSWFGIIPVSEDLEYSLDEKK